MSKTVISYHAEDISAVARSLKSQLTGLERPPGHVELLNMLARAGGYQNFQHFRAQRAALAALEEPPPTVDYALVRRLLRYFGPDGRLARWPSKFSHQQPCLWVLWSRIPARQVFTEREISRLLQAEHDFGDHALLRRELVNYGMVVRTIDCREYQRVERQPPPDTLALMRQVAARREG